MKRQKDGNRMVFQSLTMVVQFGLNMLVPICIMSALGIWLDNKLGTFCFTIILFVVGAVAGGQNIYHLVRKICMLSDQEDMAGGNGSYLNRDRNDTKKGDLHEIDRESEKGE